jgi:hypothetical protein
MGYGNSATGCYFDCSLMWLPKAEIHQRNSGVEKKHNRFSPIPPYTSLKVKGFFPQEINITWKILQLVNVAIPPSHPEKRVTGEAPAVEIKEKTE